MSEGSSTFSWSKVRDLSSVSQGPTSCRSGTHELRARDPPPGPRDQARLSVRDPAPSEALMTEGMIPATGDVGVVI